MTIGLFIVALAVRLYKIGVLTPGMWGDEISFARIAEKLLTTSHYLPYVTDNYGHPTGLFYLMGLAISFFGRSMLSIRLVSLVFGALDVCMFFVFIRLFFKKWPAFLCSLFMVFSYPHLVVSRFGYEVTAAMFFQLSSFFFLVKILRKDSYKDYIGLGLSLGLGLNTYLSFRTMAVFYFVALFTVVGINKNIKEKSKKILITTFFILLSVFPLISYGVNHWDNLWSRTKSVSVFNQGLPKHEIVNEIKGNILREINIFVGNGDPNPRHNPSSRPFFDPLTTILSFGGLYLLFKKDRQLFWISLFLLVPSFVNDIFTVEIFPEFHYYGTGHPHTLRLAGVIPIVYFWSAFAMEGLWNTFVSKERMTTLVYFLFVGASIWTNWSWYFYQPDNFFIYESNGVRMVNLVNFMNKLPGRKISVSSSMLKDERVDYFLNKNVKPEIFKPKSTDFSLEDIRKDTITIIDPKANLKYAQSLYDNKEKLPKETNLQFMVNPWKGIDAMILLPFAR
jgi:4-amino-4-deoxy-L-arabinose transferase-like glycosyltransferase